MLRVAGSLATGTVRAYDLMRMLSRDGHPSRLGQAFAEYGRIAKTLHLLSYIDADDTYRRQTSRQLTVNEGRHQLARRIYQGPGASCASGTGRDRRTNSALWASS